MAQAPYCLTRLLALRSSLQGAADVALPPGLDWCATSVNGALSASRDTGQLEVTKLLGADEVRVLGFEAGTDLTSGNAVGHIIKSLDQAFGSTGRGRGTGLRGARPRPR